MEKKEFIEAGQIINTHGIRGEVKIEVWLDSPEFLKRFKRIFIDGREVKLLAGKVHKGFLIAELEGISDVNAAMAMKGKKLSIARADARLPKGAYFIQDIIGAEVVDTEGNSVGRLVEVMESHASNIYIVRGESEHLIPAVPEFVMSTDAEAGIITVKLIEGM